MAHYAPPTTTTTTTTTATWGWGGGMFFCAVPVGVHVGIVASGLQSAS